MQSQAILSVSNLKKIFYPPWFSRQPAFTAVDSISFKVKHGEILGFLGPNGAGKTTTIQMLLGVMTPTSGTIHYFGKDFSKHRSEISKQVTYASAYARLPSRLTIEENLDIYGQIYGLSKEQRQVRIKELLTMFGLWDKRDRLTGPLSAGQMTRVMLAKAFLPHPQVVLLDEPTASLDPDIAYEVRQFILNQRRERGMTILFTSHNMAEIEEVCDRVLILKRGSIVANNTPEEIARQISKTRVQFMISADMDKVTNFLTSNEYSYTTSEHHFVSIQIDDHDVAQLLMDMAREGIDYSQISIEKPTLEDYFLQIAKER